MNTYLAPLEKSFFKNSHPEFAAQMKKYMKGQFEYFGIKAPERSLLVREFISVHGYPNDDDLESVVKNCWDLPQREYQYFAMEILGKMARKAEICRVDLYEYLILSKSWWDTVDFIASNLVGVHFQKFPLIIPDYTTKWMNSENIWLQRTTLLFQLKYRGNTDLELLTQSIEQLKGSHEFFINKAVGWALRQYSKTDAKVVIKYVQNNEPWLAPLSKREALKWLENREKVTN